jgi:hypothetical protein
MVTDKTRKEISGTAYCYIKRDYVSVRAIKPEGSASFVISSVSCINLCGEPQIMKRTGTFRKECEIYTMNRDVNTYCRCYGKTLTEEG